MLGFSRKKQIQGEMEIADAEDRKVVTSLAHKAQTHLEQYLEYYVGCLEPGYAVLITGDWGTGKTYQVRHALPDERAYYVSLFGLNSPDEIEAHVFSQMFPKKASLKKFADKLSTVNFGAPGYGSLGVNGLPSVLINTFIKNEINNSKPLIFDDLERCSVETSIILGLINRYVEHHKCRVIVIAHDEKIVEKLADSKEKVFGQTLHVEPNIDAAFAEFNSRFAGEGDNRLCGLENEVLSIFRESQTASLRVLRHVVEDARRLTATLEERHLKHHTAMVDLIRLFSALAIETRRNFLNRATLVKRRQAAHAYRLSSSANRDQQEPPPFVKSASKYSSVDISSTLLSDEVLVEMLVEGRYISDHIRESLNASAYFLEERSAPPWQIVGSFDRLEDDVVDEAVKRMEEQFSNREITESGELLHIVALKMMMASRGLTKATVRQIADAAKIYIDDLLKVGSLAPRSAGWRWYEPFETSFGGVAYWVADSY